MTTSAVVHDAPLAVVDSHCHLADEAYAADLDAVIGRARQAGVARALCIVDATDGDEQQRARDLAELWPDVRFAVGVHPHTAARAPDPDRLASMVSELLDGLPNVVAVGEIGLDYHYDFSPRDVQQAVFDRQLRLARDRALPVVIHTREADEDTLAALGAFAPDLRGVLHCFTGDRVMADRALAGGFFLSFAGIVTFPKAEALRRTASGVPEDRLLAETDSPFLAPVPHRGKRNEPAWVRRVVEELARARGVEAADLARAITANFDRLFGVSHARGAPPLR